MQPRGLSKAALKTLEINRDFVLLTGLKKYQENPFDAQTNKEGTINFGTAENRLLWPYLLEKLNQCNFIGAEQLTYPTFYGSSRLRQLVASLLNEKLKTSISLKIDPSMITCHAGCGAAVANIIQALCDPEGSLAVLHITTSNLKTCSSRWLLDSNSILRRF
jgi:aspartate/methionine/tyrosine aminotransferase